jgi:hypothetical protein
MALFIFLCIVGLTHFLIRAGVPRKYFINQDADDCHERHSL